MPILYGESYIFNYDVRGNPIYKRRAIATTPEEPEIMPHGFEKFPMLLYREGFRTHIFEDDGNPVLKHDEEKMLVVKDEAELKSAIADGWLEKAPEVEVIENEVKDLPIVFKSAKGRRMTRTRVN